MQESELQLCKFTQMDHRGTVQMSLSEHHTVPVHHGREPQQSKLYFETGPTIQRKKYIVTNSPRDDRGMLHYNKIITKQCETVDFMTDRFWGFQTLQVNKQNVNV